MVTALRGARAEVVHLRPTDVASIDVASEPLSLRINGGPISPRRVLIRYCAPLAGTVSGSRENLDWALAVQAIAHVFPNETVNAGWLLTEPHPLQVFDVAKAAGFHTPQWVISNTGRRPAGWARTVVKTVGPHLLIDAEGRWTSVPPTVLDSAETSLASCSPVMMQNYVDHHRELRANVVGDEVICYEIRQRHPAARTQAPHTVGVAAVGTPHQVRIRLLQIRDALGLEVFSADILQTPDGGYVLLEINPVFDWLWYEARAGDTAVSKAMFTLLAREM